MFPSILLYPTTLWILLIEFFSYTNRRSISSIRPMTFYMVNKCIFRLTLVILFNIIVRREGTRIGHRELKRKFANRVACKLRKTYIIVAVETVEIYYYQIRDFVISFKYHCHCKSSRDNDRIKLQNIYRCFMEKSSLWQLSSHLCSLNTTKIFVTRNTNK